MKRTLNILLPATLIGAALGLSALPALAQDGSYEGPNGGGVSRVYDPETGEYVAVKTRVAPTGATYEVQRKCVSGEIEGTGACGATRTGTGTEGQTYTRNTARVLGEERYVAGRRIIGPEGQTRAGRRWMWRPQQD